MAKARQVALGGYAFQRLTSRRYVDDRKGILQAAPPNGSRNCPFAERRLTHRRTRCLIGEGAAVWVWRQTRGAYSRTSGDRAPAGADASAKNVAQ